MPFFSFSLKKNFLNTDIFKCTDIKNIKANCLYFSKSTLLWKYLNKKEFKTLNNSLTFEKRIKIKSLDESILFFLPPKYLHNKIYKKDGLYPLRY